VNDAPSAPAITGPGEGARLVIGGASALHPADGGMDFLDVAWEAALDPDDDPVAYTYALAGDAGFSDIVYSTEVTATGFTLTVAEAAEAFGRLSGGGPGAEATVYHRVTATDGAYAAVGSVATMVWERGWVTDTEREAGLPSDYTLYGNYPNPFRGTTTVYVDLPEASRISVTVLDLLGRHVIRTRPLLLPAGSGQRISVEAASLASGTYMYRVEARMGQRTVVQTGMMTVLR
jgi:hypothetical protein